MMRAKSYHFELISFALRWSRGLHACPLTAIRVHEEPFLFSMVRQFVTYRETSQAQSSSRSR